MKVELTKHIVNVFPNEPTYSSGSLFGIRDGGFDNDVVMLVQTDTRMYQFISLSDCGNRHSSTARPLYEKTLAQLNTEWAALGLSGSLYPLPVGSSVTLTVKE